MLTDRFDFFSRGERRSREALLAQEARCISLDLPAGTKLQQALEAAWAAGMPRGSHRGGCFEVQCGEGLWQHVEGNRIDLSTPARAQKVRFRTWEQLEAEEG